MHTCVDEGCDDLHRVCGGRVGVDLANGVFGVGGVFEVSVKIDLVVVRSVLRCGTYC